MIFQSNRFLILLLLIFLLVFNPRPCDAANILFFLALGSHSHRTAIEPLAHKLVEQNHNVTFLTPMSPTKANPSFHEFSPKKLTEFYNQVITTFADDYFPRRLGDKYRNDAPNPRIMAELEHSACDLVFNAPEFKPWVESVHFDLILMDFTGNKCGYALAYKFNAVTVVHLALPFWSHEEDIFGLPISDMSWLPTTALTNVFTRDRTLYDKLHVTLFRIYSYFYTTLIALPKTEQIVREGLDLPGMPPIEEMEKNTSLLLINQHFSNDYPRSLPPHVIQVSGMHCETYKVKPLPKNLQDFIDEAGDHGFVYICFGTIVSMQKVPEDFLNEMFKTIKTSKAKFLWKWEGQPPSNLPSNVFASKWFPQLDLLASKSIRAFMTHGGQNSINEGVYYGVPLIVVPIAFDHPYNAQAAAHHEYAIHLELSEMKEKFQDSLNAILNDDKYKRRAQLVSQRFRDRPMSAVDTSAFWINYVLRNKDVSYMRPVGYLKQTWWQRRLLDVWATICTGILIILFVAVKLIKFTWRLCFQTNNLSNVKVKRS